MNYDTTLLPDTMQEFFVQWTPIIPGCEARPHNPCDIMNYTLKKPVQKEKICFNNLNDYPRISNMIIQPKFIFESFIHPCPVTYDGVVVNGPRTFDTANDMLSFLQTINWTAPYDLMRHPSEIAQFRLGTRLEFNLENYSVQSDIQWGAWFLVGLAVQNGKILTPTDIDYDPKTRTTTRDFAWQDVNLGAFDAVISPRLDQVWPRVNPQRSVLQRFLTFARFQQFQIQNISKTPGGR